MASLYDVCEIRECTVLGRTVRAGTERSMQRQMKISKLSAANEKILANCCDGLRCGDVPGCGRGIFATKKFLADDFICVYTGELITAAQFWKRYGRCDSVKSYTFHIRHDGKHLVVDATQDDGSLARLANHSWKLYNAYMEKVIVNSKPVVVMFAAKDILPGHEIRYNYGDDIVKESGKFFSWLSEIKPYN